MDKSAFPSVAAMIGLLEEQKAVHQDLLNLSYEKRQVILKGDTDRLGEIIQLEMKGLAKMNAQEKKRAAIVADLVRETSLPEADITVGALIERSDGEQRSRLVMLQKELGAILLEQAELNKLNQQLLQTQLEYGDALLNVMVEPMDPLNNFYGVDGSPEEEKRDGAGFFDTQI